MKDKIIKNRIAIVIIIAIIAAISIVGIGFAVSGGSPAENAAERSAPSAPRNAEDALRFKLEHEAYNDIIGEDGNLRHINIYIPADNTVIYLEFEQVMEFFDSGTGIFMFSRPTCPWCRVMLPTLIQTMRDKNMYIYYYDITGDRATHNENYIRILERLHNYLPVDDRNQHPDDEDFDENLKRVTVPHLFFVVDGRVIGEIMLNRHPLLADEDLDALHDFLLDMLRPVRQVTHAPRSACHEC